MLDAVDVSKVLSDSNVNVNVSGTAALASTLASLPDRSANPLTPDVNYQNSRTESVDKALRACIEAAVLQLAKRLPAAPASNDSHNG